MRGLRYHVRIWEPSLPDAAADPAARSAAAAAAEPVTVFMAHGWMDVSASFQFLVDHLPPHWRVIAPDWRGFGLTDWPARQAPGTCYWLPDYVGDLDALLDHYSPDQPVLLVGHSMGGNVATQFSGARPHRVRKLVNLEGIGLPRTSHEQAPNRLAQWLDELKTPPRLLDYPDVDAVAARLMKNNPRLRADYAAFLAPHWCRPVRQPDGGQCYELLGDPVHKLVNPVLYRVDEVLACWGAITAPVLFVLCEHLNDWHQFVKTDEYRQRLTAYKDLTRATLAGAGHMMHHDQPEALAKLIEGFLT